MPPNSDKTTLTEAASPALAMPDSDSPAPMAEDSEEQRQQSRWNLKVLTLDVAFFAMGMAFFDVSAILPLLLLRLGATGPIIGAYAALRSLSFNSVQMFVAYAMHGRARQKPMLAFVATVTRLPLLLLPFYLWHAADSPGARSFALVATILILSIWALGDGLGYVPWMDIVARAFSERTRGRFFATTQLISGITSIGMAGLVVRNVLHSSWLPYPRNYAVLAGIAAILFMISLVGVLLIREPPPTPATTERPQFTHYFRRLPSLVRGNPIFAHLAGIQLLIGFGGAASPFYVLYAIRRFHLGDEWGGTYQVMQAISIVALTPVWTFISERRGSAEAVRALSLVCLSTPLVALSIGGFSPWLFGLVFLTMGGSLGWGMWIVFNHYLLGHVSEEERPVFLALLNLLFLPSAIFPWLGGLLVRENRFLSIAGMPWLFVCTSVVIGAGVLLSLHLPAPRKQDTPPPAPSPTRGRGGVHEQL